MTKLLEQAIEAARQLSPEEQDEIALTIMELAEANGPIKLTEDEKAAIRRGREAYARGEVATGQQVRAVLAKYSQ